MLGNEPHSRLILQLGAGMFYFSMFISRAVPHMNKNKHFFSLKAVRRGGMKRGAVQWETAEKQCLY